MSEAILESSSEFRATGMLHPFQCLLWSTLAAEGRPSFLLAASKSRLFVFSVADGKLLYTWQSTQDQAEDSKSKDPFTDDPKNRGSFERPPKRRKQASSDRGSESSSTEIVTEDGKSKARKSKKPETAEPNVIKLIGTSDGQSIVAVTDEDKCVRVLRLDGNGKLQQLSKRQDYRYYR